MPDRDLLYEQELQKHVVRMVRILDSYQGKEHFSEIDILAIERGLQVLIESFIGLCRYVCDICFGIKVSRSREAIDELKKLEVLTAAEHKTLQSMIGFRNVLVHDYLNVDEMIIYSIVQKQDYSYVTEMFHKIRTFLDEKGP